MLSLVLIDFVYDIRGAQECSSLLYSITVEFLGISAIGTLPAKAKIRIGILKLGGELIYLTHSGYV